MPKAVILSSIEDKKVLYVYVDSGKEVDVFARDKETANKIKTHITLMKLNTLQRAVTGYNMVNKELRNVPVKELRDLTKSLVIGKPDMEAIKAKRKFSAELRKKAKDRKSINP